MAEEKGMSTEKILALIGFAGLWVVAAFWLKQRQQRQPIEPPPPEPPIRPTSTPIPTHKSQFKLHTSEDLGFQFKYPEDWLVRENNEFISVYNYNPEEAPQRDFIPETDGDLFKVEMFADDEFSDVDQWLENQLDQVSPITGEPNEIFNRKELEIDSQKAIFYETESSMTGLRVGNLHIETPENEILHVYGQLNYPDHIEAFEKIYQSIEFID